jgi:Ethanolamine utilization protein EutJ (predicted chaperonin)
VDYGPSIPKVGKRISNDEGFVIDEFKLNLGLASPSRKLPTGFTKRNEDVAIDVLKYLKRCGEDFLGSPLDRICLAMPPTDYERFHSDKTDLMAMLGKNAGFSIINVIEEPLAAILDVDFTMGGILTHEDKTIMVVDYGGGTCDVAIVKASYKKFLWSRPPQPLGLGTEQCGGKFIDEEIATWIKTHRPKAIGQSSEGEIKEVARKLKEKMSRRIRGEDVTNPSTIDGRDYQLDENTFRNLSERVIPRMLNAVNQALEQAEAKLSTPAVDLIFLVGGGSKHPLVESTIEKYFTKDSGGRYGIPKIRRAQNPQLSVSRGAALYDFYCSVGKLPMVDELDQELCLQFPDGSTKRLAYQGQAVPFRHPNHFEIRITDPTNELVLQLKKRDPMTKTEQVYASPPLDFQEQLSSGTKVRLDVTVDLRKHVIIKAYTRKRLRQDEKELSKEVIVRSPLS